MDSNVRKKLEGFFQKYRSKKYRKNELLISVDEEPLGLFYLKEGVVRQYAITSDGDETVINLFKSDSFFPVSWVINDAKITYFYEALTPVTVWICPKKDALEFLKGNADVLFDLLKRIYVGLEGYFTKTEKLMHGSARLRLITEMLILAKRFGKIEDHKMKLEIKITERDLAAQLGMARETVSREIKKLKSQKLISLNKKTLTLTDPLKLEEELISPGS